MTRKNRTLCPYPTTIDRLNECTLFTKFDVRWGYNNVRYKPGDEWKAAFLRMASSNQQLCFGLTNSQQHSQMMMNTISEKKLPKVAVRLYDDIAIHSNPQRRKRTPNIKARHADYTHLVLDKLETNNCT